MSTHTAGHARGTTELGLEGEADIVITRTFNAPARAVFDAWTRPELLRKWWAPRSRGVEIVSMEADVRVGGTYRYVFRSPRTPNVAFSGSYLEVDAPTRLVNTEAFEPTAEGPMPGPPAVNTVTFTEKQGRTVLVCRSRYPSEEVRSMVLETGMEDGMRETMEQLEDLVSAAKQP